MDANATTPLENSSYQVSDVYEYDYFGFGNPDIYDPVLNIILCVTSSFGIAENVFVLTIMWGTNFGKKLSLLFLAHQSICDLVSSFSMLVTTVALWSQATGNFYCYLLWSEACIFTGLYASVFNTVSLAAERYLMIMFPFKYRVIFTKERACWVMVTIWPVSMVLNIPSITTVYVENGQCQFDYFLKSVKAQEIYSYILIIVTFLIPVIFICFAYGHMLCIITKHNQVHPGPTKRCATMSKVQMNIFQTLVLITVVFMVTWIPNQIYYLLYSIGVPLNFFDPLYYISLVLVQINACVNPFIYIYKFKSFRAHAMALLKCQSMNQTVPSSR